MTGIGPIFFDGFKFGELSVIDSTSYVQSLFFVYSM